MPRFLEIGFGDGSALAAAAELGWEPYGLEYAEWLVTSARERLRLQTVSAGDVLDARFDAHSFDLIYAWHVVEHVLDVRAWLAELRRILVPGGTLVLGTESADGLQGKLWTASFRLAHRIPWPPTSTDHTYWFGAGHLRRVLEDAGFVTAEVEVYENSPREILRSQSRAVLRNPRWVAALVLYTIGGAAAQIRPAWGGKLRVVARAPAA